VRLTLLFGPMDVAARRQKRLLVLTAEGAALKMAGEGADLNSLCLLGFSSSLQAAQEGRVSLQSIRSNSHAVVYCVDRNGDLRTCKVLEPWHDSNKLYAFIASIPLEAAVKLDPEDAGVEEIPFNEPHAASDHANLHVIGGGWLNPGDDPSPASRFMVLVRHPQSKAWTCAASRTGECPSSYKSPDKLTSLCARAGIQLEEGALLVPMLQPKKVILEGGVVFIG
jgi:hypothetical protein